MFSLNRFFLCSCVFICVSNIYGGKDQIVEKDRNKIDTNYYYFDFNYEYSSKGEMENYYYIATDKIRSLIKKINDKSSDEYKMYYIDKNSVYCYNSFLESKTYYNIIRKKKYRFVNNDKMSLDFKNKINDSYLKDFLSLINDILNNYIDYGSIIKNKDLSKILEIEYNFEKLQFSLKLKKEIDEKYLKKTAKTEPKSATTTTEAKGPEPKSTTTTTTTTEDKESKTIIVKKNITLKKVVNKYLAPDAEKEFNSYIEIKEILKDDKIDEKILGGLKGKFTNIKDTDYELYSDKEGKTKFENIEFDSINNNDVIYVKIKQFYLDENQKKAVDELNGINLEEKDKDIYFIYELIDKINSNIEIIKDHQYCKNFINKYNNEATGLIKQYNFIIDQLVSQCKNINKEISKIDETLEETNLNKLKEDQIDKFNKLVRNYESNDISKYTNLNNIINDYNKALENLDNRIKLFKEYKKFIKTVESNVNVLIQNIKNKNITEIDNFDNFKNSFNFEEETKLEDKYKKYNEDYNTFVNSLKISFDNAINNKKSEFDKNSLKNENSKKIYDEINKNLDEYKKSYSDINNINDEKLKNTEETIKNEINKKINSILTDKLASITENKNEIETEIKNKFKDEDIKNNVNAILNIITVKKEELKIKFTLTKKNTENLRDNYLAKFNNIINKYKSGVYNNVKFSDLRSEISEKRNDINLFVNNTEVDYNQNIVKDTIISVYFSDSYIKKISLPDDKDKDKGNGDGNNNEDDKEDEDDNDDKDEKNKNNIDDDKSNNVATDNGDTNVKGCSGSTKKKQSGKKCCKK